MSKQATRRCATESATSVEKGEAREKRKAMDELFELTGVALAGTNTLMFPGTATDAMGRRIWQRRRQEAKNTLASSRLMLSWDSLATIASPALLFAVLILSTCRAGEGISLALKHPRTYPMITGRGQEGGRHEKTKGVRACLKV